MNLLNASQTKALDAYTLAQQEISSADLMERAAQASADFVVSRYPNREQPISLFAGPGNNGGDGLAMARQLAMKGYKNLRVCLFNTRGALSPDCSCNAARLRKECPAVPFVEVTKQFEAPQIASDELIIDALFGIGLNKPLGGGFAALVKFINATRAEVVSIDMPSGLMCEDNTFNTPSAIVRATHTLTMGRLKLAQILADNQPYVGELHCLDIGLEKTLPSGEISPYFITDCSQVRAMLRQRPAYGHKGTFGNALLVAGKWGMAGAAVLAAKACLRTGVGKVTVHTPQQNNCILQTAVPEAVLQLDNDEKIFSFPSTLDGFQALAIGCGLGTDKRTALAFIEQVNHASIPLVIDADAINILGDHRGWIPQIPRGAIFTPHPREMQKLGICNADSFSILSEALNTAKQHGFYVVLKGHYTAVCTPEGRAYFNPTGNSGMATAGSGDVLTGMILALLAQQYPAECACRLGVYLHGLAGDLAAKRLGEHSVTASDLVESIPAAFLSLIQTD